MVAAADQLEIWNSGSGYAINAVIWIGPLIYEATRNGITGLLSPGGLCVMWLPRIGEDNGKPA